MTNNLVNINSLRKTKINQKMLIIIIAVTVFLSLFIWNKYVENPSDPNIAIPESPNVSYNLTTINSITPNDVISEIEDNYGKPILLYLYTTWCPTCKKQTPVINEIARKFQGTELKVIALAIDKNNDQEKMFSHLSFYNDVYFEPYYLSYNDGLADLLKQKSVEYNKKIPFTAIISRSGAVMNKYTGYKSEKYLDKKIMRAL